MKRMLQQTSPHPIHTDFPTTHLYHFLQHSARLALEALEKMRKSVAAAGDTFGRGFCVFPQVDFSCLRSSVCLFVLSQCVCVQFCRIHDRRTEDGRAIRLINIRRKSFAQFLGVGSGWDKEGAFINGFFSSAEEKENMEWQADKIWRFLLRRNCCLLLRIHHTLLILREASCCFMRH